MAMESPLVKVYPEMQAGGFTRRDGTVQFYSRVNALIRPDFTVLDLGAGRGAWQDSPVDIHRSLCSLRGKVSRIIGADVDPVVLANSGLDEAVVIAANDVLPFDDSAFDLVLSDHTLEHIDEPRAFAAEIRRVVRPGGWFCARTPYRWGSTGIATNLIPNLTPRCSIDYSQRARNKMCSQRDIDSIRCGS